LSILIAVAVKTDDGLSPYVLMGADSLKLETDPNLNVITRNEEAKKVFRINNKVFCMAGRTDSVFNIEILKFLEENDSNLLELSLNCIEFMKNYFLEIEQYEDAKCAIYLGSCENGIPKLAFTEMKKADIESYRFEIMEASQINSFVPGFAGSISVPTDDDLSETFIKRLQNNCFNLNLTCVKKAARDYLKNAALRYPDTCNQNIQFEVLRCK
jgi:hypothetical protein